MFEMLNGGCSIGSKQCFKVQVWKYACTVWNHKLTSALSNQLESYQNRALRIIYGDQIKGMPYQNTLFLANLESLKDRRIKLSQSFFKKILSANSCLHTLVPPERNNKSSPNYVNPWNIQCPTQEPKDISPSSTMPWPTSKTTNDCVLFFFFMLWTVYCIMCILYRVFLLYHMPILFIVCSLCFTNPASWLP